MKLLRWAAAGASVYVVYRYSIGKKAKGEDVFQSPERDLEATEASEDVAESDDAKAEESKEEPKKAKPRRKRRTAAAKS